jgi:peptide/nickel transport system substrate-binding protein
MVAVAGCGATSDTTGQSGDEGPDELVIAMAQELDTPDTHSTTSVATEAVMVNVLSYLLKRDDAGTLEPLLAEEYENVDDLTWSFTLKPGITFHNGDPLTSEDVKFSLERVASDETLVQHANFSSIAEVRVIDDTHFEIVTDGPDPALPYRLAREGAGIMPKEYIEENGWDVFLADPVGSGPYEFVEWVQGDHLTLSKYPDYFGGDVSEWDTVVFRAIPEASTRVSELLTGGAQIADNIPVVDWDRVDDNDGTALITSDTTSVQMMYVNQNPQFATSDPLVREAIDYAIDKQALSDIFTGGEGALTRTRVMPGAFGADESLYGTARFDQDEARSLLEQAGYDEGELEITLTSSQGRSASDSDIAQTIAGMLEEVGITVDLELLEASRYVEVRTTGQNEELLTTGWNNTLYDASLPLSHFRSDYSPAAFGYDNPRVDELLDAAAVNMDPESRAEQYREVQQIVAEELPYIYLYQMVGFTGVSDELDYQPRVDQMFYVEEIEKAG